MIGCLSYSLIVTATSSTQGNNLPAYTCAGVSPLLIDSIIIHEEEHMSASVMSGEVTIAKVIPSRSRGNHYFVTGATA